MREETPLQAEILKYLNSLDRCKAIKVVKANEDGVSDIICCYRGHYVAFEVKDPNLSRKEVIKNQNQQVFILEVVQAGGLGYFVQSLAKVKHEIFIIDEMLGG